MKHIKPPNLFAPTQGWNWCVFLNPNLTVSLISVQQNEEDFTHNSVASSMLGLIKTNFITWEMFNNYEYYKNKLTSELVLFCRSLPARSTKFSFPTRTRFSRGPFVSLISTVIMKIAWDRELFSFISVALTKRKYTYLFMN